jgi:hypothetical protein
VNIVRLPQISETTHDEPICYVIRMFDAGTLTFSNDMHPFHQGNGMSIIASLLICLMFFRSKDLDPNSAAWLLYRNGRHVLSACAFALLLLALHSITSQYAWFHIGVTSCSIVANLVWNWKDVCSFFRTPLRAENSSPASPSVGDALSTEDMVKLMRNELNQSATNLRTEFINIEGSAPLFVYLKSVRSHVKPIPILTCYY